MKIATSLMLVAVLLGTWFQVSHGFMVPERVELGQYKLQGGAPFPGFSFNSGNPFGNGGGTCGLTKKWEQQLSYNGAFMNPAVDAESNVYVGGSDGFLRKIASDGTLLWEVELCAAKGSLPEHCDLVKQGKTSQYLPFHILVGKSNAVFTIDLGTVFKFDKDGNLLWKNEQISFEKAIPPAIDHKGNLIFASSNRVGKLDGETGDLVKEILLDAQATPQSNIAIASNGDILVATFKASTLEGKLVRIRAQAWKPWKIAWQQVLALSDTSPYFAFANGMAIDACDNIVVTTRNGYVKKFDRDGNVLWSIASLAEGTLENRHIQAKPAIDSSGSIYVQIYGNRSLVKLRDDGQVLWQIPTDVGSSKSVATLGSDGTLFMGFGGHVLLMLDTETGARLSTIVAHTSIAANAAIAPDGTIYFLDSGDWIGQSIRGGTLYAVATCPESPLHDPTTLPKQQCP